MKKHKKLVLLSVLLSSCSYFHTPVLSPYKMEIRQGNFVTSEMRDELRVGMTKAQVRYLLGTPMISDAFHGNRWDYAYRLAQQGKLVEKQHLALYFENDRLVRAEEDGKPLRVESMVAATDQPAREVAATPVPAENAVVQKPAKPAPATEILATEVLSAVENWAAMWVARDVNKYLAAYTSDFAPQDMNHDAWKKLRTERISKPKVIEVKLGKVGVNVQDDTHATASFRQSYRSDLYRDEVEKTLHMVKRGGNWLIVEERAGKKTGK